VPDEQLALLQATTNPFLRDAIESALAPPPTPPKAAAATAPPSETPASPTPVANKRSSIMSPNLSSRPSTAFTPMAPPPSGLTVSRKPGGRKPTLGSIFKGSLISLMDTIGSTNVHYIRCIKPNEQKAPWAWDAPQVLGQLRACGVLETIRISCAGYPSRWAFEDFAERYASTSFSLFPPFFAGMSKLTYFSLSFPSPLSPLSPSLPPLRYYMLINSKHWQGELKEVCSLILDETIKEDDKYQVGLTKLFFRTGMLAYLEGLRADRLNHLVTLVQKNLRRQIASRQYTAMKVASVRIQSWWRGIAARKLVDAKRKDAAVVKIQKVVRGYIQRKKFLETRAAAVKIQSGSSFALIPASDSRPFLS
jgi:myosin-5